MNAAADIARSPRRAALVAAAIGLLIAVAIGWIQPRELASAWRFAGFVCLEAAVGSLIFLLIFRSAGGQWGRALLPFLRTGARFLPWIWLLLIPLHWLGPEPPSVGKPPEGLLAIYLGSPASLVRDLLYAAVFFWFWWLTRPARGAGVTRGEERPWFGPVGLIVVAFTLHLLAVDWLMRFDAGWFSTAFPLIWMSGSAMMGLALAVLTALVVGLDPRRKGESDRAVGLDWGNLLLTSVIFWIYVSFMQFLILWSGNIARETTFYVHRGHGVWRWIVVGLAVCNLALPFFALLSRDLKQRARALGGVAALLLVCQFVYTAWLILPAEGAKSPWAYGLDAALLLAAAGVFFNRYLAVSASEPLTP